MAVLEEGMDLMKTLYVSDLDGTLLNSDTALSENTISIINKLVEEGMEFTFATARSIVSASMVSKGLHLRTPLIVYNGVYLLDSKDYSILHSQTFNKQEAKAILSFLIAHGQFPFVYAYVDGIERVSYIEHDMHEGASYYMESRVGDKRFRKVENINDLLDGEIFYFTCMQDKEVLQPIYDILEIEHDYVLILQQELYREEYWLEIMPHNVSKAQAIVKLKELGNYDRIVSFGDAMNDIAMFQISDECYAVENAIDELKAIATEVIEDHDQDGVANWLLKNYKKEENL